MNKTLLYAIVAITIAVLFFMLNDEPEVISENIETSSQNKVAKNETNDELNIVYEKTSKKSNATSSKKVKKIEQESFNMDNVEYISETTSENFGIYLISDYELRQPDDIFPQIPAVLKGTINGEEFSLMIPVGIENNDLRIRIKNFKNKKIKEYKRLLTGLSSGSVNSVTFDFNNLQSATITSKIQGDGDAQHNAPPPIPGI